MNDRLFFLANVEIGPSDQMTTYWENGLVMENVWKCILLNIYINGKYRDRFSMGNGVIFKQNTVAVRMFNET